MTAAETFCFRRFKKKKKKNLVTASLKTQLAFSRLKKRFSGWLFVQLSCLDLLYRY